MMRTEPISAACIAGIMAKTWGIPIEDVPADAKFGDLLEWDSMGHVALLAALEQVYGIVINYEIITELMSIDAIVNHLKGMENVG